MYTKTDMEKTFANATLLSASVLAAFMLLIPINHLSAESEAKIDENAKFHAATIEHLDLSRSDFTIQIESLTVPVLLDASTTVYLANGDEATLTSLKDGASVYIFGQYSKQSGDILAEKIVLRNKPITTRTTLSRAQIAAGEGKETDEPFALMNLLSAK